MQTAPQFPEFLQGLNDPQRTAVTHREGPLLIVAGAGTGKTSVITRRIAWLIKEGLAKPENILALTFTEKSAREMEERVDKLLPYGYVDLWIQTFHGFGEKILRAHALDIGLSPSFKILSKTEQWMLLRKKWQDLNLSYYRPLGNPTKFLDALLTHFSRAEDELVRPEDYLRYAQEHALGGDSSELSAEESKRLKEVADAFHFYKRELREEGALDFSDLINETLRLFRERPGILEKYRKTFQYILVDEFQDTNWAQYELLKLLGGTAKSSEGGSRTPRGVPAGRDYFASASGGNITVVGDDDQSIYKFRGASISNILDFQKDFPDCAKVVLSENYRSKQEILDLAHAFIQHNNPDRLEAAEGGGISKRLTAEKGSGATITHLHAKTLEDEARLVVEHMQALKNQEPETTWNDFAILVRANDHALPFLSALKIAGIPHEFSASRGLYQKPVIMDILSYLRLLDDYHESAALYRVLSCPVVEIAQEDLMRLTHFASKKSVSLYEALERRQEIPELTAEARGECERLLGLIARHSILARTKPVGVVVLGFLNDAESGYLKRVLGEPEERVRETMRYLEYFWKLVERSQNEDEHLSVRTFLERVDYEMEAGDSGHLPFDPESGPELVRVMTLHTSKGLEFRHVFLVNLVDKRFPTIERKDAIPLPDAFIHEKLPHGDAHLQEERRLFYVGCTRAKETLTLTSADDYGGVRKKKLSRFLIEAGFREAEAQGAELVVSIEQSASDGGWRLPLPERMSYSQFEAFARCPLQYKLEHIYRIPKAGNANKSFGQSIHLTLQELLTRYQARRASSQQSLFGAAPAAESANMTLGAHIREDELLDIYREKWIEDWYSSKESRLERFARGKEILLEYYRNLKDKTLEIHGLEQGFSLKLPGVTIKGRIDRIDRNPDGTVEIIDYKTGKAKEKPDRKQLLIYQLAAERILGVTPSKLTFVYLEGGSEVSFLGTGEELQEFESEIVDLAAKIRTSSFGPTPNEQICKYCEFNRICEHSAHP